MAVERDVVVQILLAERLRIAAVATAIVRDVHAADDIFQQVVLAALEHSDHFENAEHVMGWAIRAARHRAVDVVNRRRVKTLPDEVLDLLEDQWVDPAAARWSDRAEALRRCMSRLAEAKRELLRLKYADGLTAAAIADKQSRSADAVYQNLSRVHRTLRECVERELCRAEQSDGPWLGRVS